LIVRGGILLQLCDHFSYATVHINSTFGGVLPCRNCLHHRRCV